jgi:hypothetical protein
MKKPHQMLPVLVSFLLLAQPAVAQSPALDSLSSLKADRSGRIVLHGSGFGSEQNNGRVTVDGLPAIITRWLPNEIHAYVPEAASLGKVDVQVVTGRGESAALSIEVTPREPVGRIVWQFQTNRWMSRQFVEVGPDRRVYTSDNLGLYALSADGALLWFVPGAGGGFPIDIGPDGTIYTGVTLGEGPEIIRALNPDGSLRWEFVPPVSWPLVAGPNVGPDGNIYAAQKFPSDGGLGFFSLDPQGELRWSNPGAPPLDGVYGGYQTSSEIVFASDRLYAGVLFLRSGHPSTFALSLSGDQIWFTGDLDVLFHTFPRVDPQERAIGVWGQTGIVALRPDGSTDWITLHPDPNLLLIPAIDSEGNIYTGDLIGVDLWSLTPDGETRWVGPPDEIMRNVGVSPNESVVVASGNDGAGADSWVIGHEAATGARRWKQILPREEGLPQYSTNLYPMFSADSRTAYLTTHFSDVNAVEHGYLLAIAIAGDLRIR